MMTSASYLFLVNYFILSIFYTISSERLFFIDSRSKTPCPLSRFFTYAKRETDVRKKTQLSGHRLFANRSVDTVSFLLSDRLLTADCTYLSTYVGRSSVCMCTYLRT